MLFKVIKTILEFFKEKYKKALRDAKKQKNSETNGSNMRKNSRDKFKSLKTQSRNHNSYKALKGNSSDTGTADSGKNKVLDNYLSNKSSSRVEHRKKMSIHLQGTQKLSGVGTVKGSDSLLRGHRRSNNSTIPFSIVQKSGNKSSMIGDCSAIPMQP